MCCSVALVCPHCCATVTTVCPRSFGYLQDGLFWKEASLNPPPATRISFTFHVIFMSHPPHLSISSRLRDAQCRHPMEGRSRWPNGLGKSWFDFISKVKKQPQAVAPGFIPGMLSFDSFPQEAMLTQGHPGDLNFLDVGCDTVWNQSFPLWGSQGGAPRPAFVYTEPQAKLALEEPRSAGIHVHFPRTFLRRNFGWTYLLSLYSRWSSHILVRSKKHQFNFIQADHGKENKI